ncbi:hypothetical protein L2E82_13621 [Cichorium intybus]|uniref:Uncharacterized protein n=1 Tax=Cichorium intybus TaxID=13427 RepID=A0ACB9EYY0_CICIN|nr:hypothetical protein L2E82_13621 [Cichorium intybus]
MMQYEAWKVCFPTGNAVMPDEIINYVQSLQKQVELLSMNLATVNPELDFNIDSVFGKRPALRVLILTPRRELAVQIHSMIGKLAQSDWSKDVALFFAQEAALRSLPDIVVATPGRMIDHLLNSMSVDLDDLAVLILDEADRLLELGFEAEICELALELFRSY